eukprot:TRINITY_DN511_c0_g2_i1.p1 TRINITY_DN511_c0_g2~~TRINITY_DN511_c0_g2_i1.p1  ORF type:complete len:330 (-),score=66.62 TRINITY_DN511_c0_g2_i1:143-1132(-)
MFNHNSWGDTVAILSLASGIVLYLSDRKGNGSKNIYVPPRSLLVLKDEARYSWALGVIRRDVDYIHGESVLRETRISLTFRIVNLNKRCFCDYPEVCNGNRTPDSIPFKNAEGLEAKEIEKMYVHGIYDEIAEHWDATRHTPWKQVQEFLESQPENILIADVGCGNGKYLSLLPKSMMIGCDISANLIKICRDKGHEVYVCDAKHVPYRENVFDLAISIAVMHHIACEDDRIKILSELLRIVKPGGEVLVCAWALEQELHSKRRFEEQDVIVPWNFNSKFGDGKKEVYHRYCHVYREGELESLWEQIPGADIVNQFYDCSNWCVHVRKQ